jgi:DNA-binding MarR family transcriptional regulator
VKKTPAKATGARSSQEQRIRKTIVTFRRVVTAVKRHLAGQDGHAEGMPSGAQLWALWHVQSSPGCTVLELTDKLSLHQSTTSNLVEKLESSGCLTRTRDEADRRVVRLFVTKVGAKILKQAPDPASGRLPEAIARLSPTELAALETALQSLSRELGVTPDVSRR